MENQTKRLYTIILIAIVVLAAGYFYWRGSQKPVEETSKPVKASGPAVSGTLPSISPRSVSVPEINPVDKANPFKNVYKNPFK